MTPIAGNTYRPITPVRLLDTRCGIGLSGKLPLSMAVANGALGVADAGLVTKSSVILGMGETEAEVMGALGDLRVKRTTEVFDRTDLGLVVAAGVGVAIAISNSPRALSSMQ